MSAESGLGTYRGSGGSWTSSRADADGLTPRQRASAEALRVLPESTLDAYAVRWSAMRAAVPHEGYQLLARLRTQKPAGAFVYTSNVDRLFTSAGFAAEHLYEVHGTFAMSQCLARCGVPPWETPATGPSLCPSCGVRGRPNVLLFDDYDFDGSSRDRQWQAWAQWLADRRDAKLVVLEVGAGTAIPTIRHRSEAFAAQGWPLIRINVDDPSIPAVPAGSPRRQGSTRVGLRLEARAALRHLLGRYAASA